MRPSILLLVSAFSIAASAQQPDRVQVYGNVVDKVTGKPVYECLIEHYDMAGKRWSVTTVNSDGRYSLFIPTGKDFELRIVRENGYAELDQRVAAVASGTKLLQQDLVLTPR